MASTASPPPARPPHRYKTLLLPILIHGSFDFAQFLLSDGYLAIVGFVLGVLIVVLSYVYIRKREPSFVYKPPLIRENLDMELY